MHTILARQLKRAGVDPASGPGPGQWPALVEAVGRAYEQADHDRYLLERSLSLSSEEMGELHAQLATERDTISTVICSLAEGVCAVDRAGAILFINPEARRLLRLGPDQAVLGGSLTALVRARTDRHPDLAAILVAPPPAGEERRLLVDEDPSAFISLTVAPLGAGREGLVLSLRDITARKRLETEREELHRRLIDLSREAGMAEIAAGVLHNVGNVLASVNVSASVASELVRNSACSAVARVAALLEANRARLPEFLASDPAGSKVTEYLVQLASTLAAERDAVLAELTQLTRRIGHIGEIVATQQSYAKAAGLNDYHHVHDLVDEALRVTEAAMERHRVSVVRDLRPVAPVLVDRHRVLQILVNVLTNAKQALQTAPREQRRITVAVYPEGGEVVVEVRDNGCGIPQEQLKRIFSHGFTTRPGGHGFGLHSAALAARAMNGSLGVSSDGPGTGAAFTLRIPAEPALERSAA
ncbi:MAG: ATP-binding protein [Phycisphaerales bacterium]